MNHMLQRKGIKESCTLSNAFIIAYDTVVELMLYQWGIQGDGVSNKYTGVGQEVNKFLEWNFVVCIAM